MLSVKGKVLLNKAGNKKVAMVVARLHTQCKRTAIVFSSQCQHIGFKLLMHKPIGIPLINQNRQLRLTVLDQL